MVTKPEKGVAAMPKRPKNKMPVSDRAKQFMPFSALKGFEDALRAKEKVVVSKIELSQEMEEELDRKMHLLEKGKIATIVYFCNGEYLKVTGMVVRVDITSRLLQIVNTKIRFDDILDISIEKD